MTIWRPILAVFNRYVQRARHENQPICRPTFVAAIMPSSEIHHHSCLLRDVFWRLRTHNHDIMSDLSYVLVCCGKRAVSGSPTCPWSYWL